VELSEGRLRSLGFALRKRLYQLKKADFFSGAWQKKAGALMRAVVFDCCCVTAQLLHDYTHQVAPAARQVEFNDAQVPHVPPHATQLVWSVTGMP